jgi:hypothetical protein
MLYYKILNNKGDVVGVTNSSALRFYSTLTDRMLCCDESLAQYLYHEGVFYRVEWFKKEVPKLKGQYPIIQAQVISKEEFDELKLV